MKYFLTAGVGALAIALSTQLTTHAQQPAEVAVPRFNASGELIRPTDFREWIFVTSGLGMTYSEPASGQAARAPNFTNVYVNPPSYRAFLKTGKWPDKTMFILEIRASASEGSINKGGHFQSDLAVIEASVKDATRFPGTWAYFNFGRDMKTQVAALPPTERCYSCHSENAAVDNTFVQFYPTLLEVAKKFGTLKSADATPSEFQKAIARYGHTLESNPADANAYYQRALVYEAIGHDLEAIEDLSAFIKLNPKSAAGFERRATIYFRMGELVRAGSDYAAAALLDPRNPDALYGRGLTQRLDRFNPAGEAAKSIAEAMAIQADVAERMAARGVR